jgi:hypothetical protein
MASSEPTSTARNAFVGCFAAVCVVLVGRRGAHLLLPQSRGLVPRPPRGEDGLLRVSDRGRSPRAAAWRRIDDPNRRRTHFLTDCSDRAQDDPLLYDLVLNASCLLLGDPAGIVVDALGRRPLDQPAGP